MKFVLPDGWPRPSGYAHGVVGRGRILFIAGQCAYDEHGRIEAQDFAGQFAAALDRLLAVVRAAGGTPQSLAQLTVFVVSMDEYLASRAQLGGIWRARLGYHYPAMAVVGVTRLVHPAAKVEIQGLALLEEER